jgi:transcription initiation factor TFIID subunit 2
MADDVEQLVELADTAQSQFAILKQRVDLDFDFAHRSLRGSTEITVQPLVRDLKEIRLHCRQCRPTSVQMGGIGAKWELDDPYRRLRVPPQSNVHQHGMLRARIERSLQSMRNPELTIAIPPKLKIQELQLDNVTSLPLYNGVPSLEKQETDFLAIADGAVTPGAQQQGPQFAPIKLTIEFEIDHFRDGLHWIGCHEGDRRYPYVYSKALPLPGNTSCIFPCLDDGSSRCTWEIAIRAPRTLGDAFRTSRQNSLAGTKSEVKGGGPIHKADPTSADEFLIDLGPEEAALDLVVICVGELSDDISDLEDETRHTLVFTLNETVTARHIALAIGPFEAIDLTMFRAAEDDEKLGQTAVKVVNGYCLPGRSDEVENTCLPICQAIDYLTANYGRFPFTNYQMLFVDDLVHDVVDGAGLSICSARLLFPQEIIEPLDRHTRVLVRAVANQWSGVNIIPKQLEDTWVTSGIAGFMTDLFMKKLAGNNEYRWQQKLAAEKVYELDVDRPSIWHLGPLQHLDSSIRDFIDLKSALVLGILDRRLVKSSGSTGVTRSINRIFLNAKTGSLVNSELTTEDFQRTCEKYGHNKLESFFKQWVKGAGCPIFSVSQRFNKKKTVVEMTITQMQLQRVTKPAFEPSNFMREIKEYVQEVWAPEMQAVFTGPMTIRIHEADGTPYEHIVEIREAVTKLEIQYNTKYKRLKRSRRQKERAMADGPTHGEGSDEPLLYSLGDVLDSAQDLKDWRLAEWSAEDEERMGQESYEWIRMDADFEWIGKIHLFMPSHMYISQLQQDRDLVAQYDSMKFILGMAPHHVSLTLMVRTLMDTRYFHGIRVMAAEGIATLAKDKEGGHQLSEIGMYQLEKAFSHMFCDEGSVMPRPNDFSSRVTFLIQCAIPRAMATFRDADNRVPRALQQFFVDKLKFNDNSENPVSDCHYIATLMKCLADSLVVSHREIQPAYDFSFGDEEPTLDAMDVENPDAEFEQIAVGEIERYRRIDEWVVTYQNIYSTTAIECLQKLTKAGIVKDKRMELLQYTRPSTAENVRLAAFRCLNEIGLCRKMPALKHLIHSIVDHSSPYFRDRLTRLFGEALGHIALDDVEPIKPAPPPPTDGLILEQDAINTVSLQELDAARKATPEGAIATLKSTLPESGIFRDALWYAITSPDITIDEVAHFCDVAELMFEPVTAAVVTLHLPKMYRCRHLGKGKIRFYREGAYRTAPSSRIGLDVDDYTVLEANNLRYTGPLSTATKKYIEEKKSQQAQIETLKLKPPQASAQALNAPSQSLAEMPPPLSAVAMNAERTGFKLSLGGIKRKMSNETTQETPKVVKLGKLSTPKNPAAIHRNIISTPAPKLSVDSQSGVVTILRLRKENARRRAKEILSSIPRSTIKSSPGAATPAPSQARPPASRSSTPSVPSQHPAKSSQSPVVQPSTSFSTPSTFAKGSNSPSLNVGAFRSYAGSGNDPQPKPQPTNPGKFRPDTSGTASPVIGVVRPPPPPPSSDVAGANDSAKDEPPPQKKKFTLKFSKKG